MGYHNRIESRTHATFITTRTIGSRLWFANNPRVEHFTLALLAKLTTRYDSSIYASAIEGSHIHLCAKFPHLNRFKFTRDFNSGVARAVQRFTLHYPGGHLWQRRYSGELIADDFAIERQFFYTVLQPVRDGLVAKISDYPFYNCFHDAVSGVKRTFKLLNYSAYNAAKRHNPAVKPADFLETYSLAYARLPGYEHLSQRDYRILMNHKLEEHRQEILRERAALEKHSFLGREALLKTIPGAPALNPKTSTINSFRPRVIASSPNSRAIAENWYFSIYFKFKDAARRFLAGELWVKFPPGTFRPPLWMATLPSGPTGPYSLIRRD